MDPKEQNFRRNLGPTAKYGQHPQLADTRTILYAERAVPLFTSPELQLTQNGRLDNAESNPYWPQDLDLRKVTQSPSFTIYKMRKTTR